MIKNSWLFLLAFIPFFMSCDTSEPTEDYGLQRYSDSAIIISSINDAFDEAEIEVFGLPPDPDDKPLGPDPNPKKCACKGTGVITHGDGHKTKCPFHSIELIMNKYQKVEQE